MLVCPILPHTWGYLFLNGILTHNVSIIENDCHGRLCDAISKLLFTPSGSVKKKENFHWPILPHLPQCTLDDIKLSHDIKIRHPRK